MADETPESKRGSEDRQRRDRMDLVKLLIKSATAIVLDLISRGHLSL